MPKLYFSYNPDDGVIVQTWILYSNPSVYDLQLRLCKALKDHRYSELLYKIDVRDKDDFRKNDRAVIRVGGAGYNGIRGIYGFVEVISNPELLSDAPDPFHRTNTLPRGAWRVWVRITRNLVMSPVSLNQLLEAGIDEPSLHYARQTSSWKLGRDDFGAIERLADGNDGHRSAPESYTYVPNAGMRVNSGPQGAREWTVERLLRGLTNGQDCTGSVVTIGHFTGRVVDVAVERDRIELVGSYTVERKQYSIAALRKIYSQATR